MSSITSTAFCTQCGEKKSFTMQSQVVTTIIRGTKFSCVEKSIFCTDCGQELYSPDVNDENVVAREDAYRKAAGLITRDEIRSIMNKYNIGAGPLSQAIGFGEITISRYLSGNLPSKTNSDLLLGILSSHVKMEQLLETNRDTISDVAYRKCRQRLNEIKELYSDRKIEVITRYLLRKVTDITPLALQKLLYYTQAFYYPLYQEELFPDTCQAWAHGPVYPDVYQKYRHYGFNPIDQPCLENEDIFNELTTKEVEFLNSVIDAFGNYSGTALEKMTHNEQPWIEARGKLLPSDRGVTVISKKTIHSYFENVVKQRNINNPCDIKNYSKAMAELLL